MTWLRFDPDEVLGFDEVEALDMEALGLYLWLAARSWKQGALKDDPEHYKALLRGRCRAFDRAWEQVRKALDEEPDGLRIGWVEDERDSAEKRLKNDAARQAIQRTKRGSSRRSHAGVTRDSRVSHKPESGSGSPTDKTDKTDGRTPVVADEPRPDPKPKKARAVPDTPHHQFIAWWMETFEKVTGSSYGNLNGKDVKCVQLIRAKAGDDLDEMKRRALILLHAAPAWIDSGGKDLGTLLNSWAKLVSQGTGQATGSKLVAVQNSMPQAKPALPPSIFDTLPITKELR